MVTIFHFHFFNYKYYSIDFPLIVGILAILIMQPFCCRVGIEIKKIKKSHRGAEKKNFIFLFLLKPFKIFW